MSFKCFQDIRFFVASISLLLFVDVIAGVYFRSALTTIERRFELSSTKIALLSSAFQVGNLAVMAFVSYYGSRSHRPRFIAIGSSLVAAGYLVSCLPQFFGGRYEYVDTMKNISTSTSKHVEMCDAHTSPVPNATSCQQIEKDSGNNLYILIVIGLTLSGIGATPLQPLGMSYIDDFSHPKKSPVYIGIVMTVALIGPAFGFILGAALMRIWVDVGWVDTSQINIKPTNPSWVGAWWLGFLLTGILIAFATIPICFFPKKMKKQIIEENTMPEHPFSENKSEETREIRVSEKLTKKKSGILHATKRLFTNKTFLLLILMWCFSGFHIVGVITFLPKYLEVQFGVSASKANMYYGAIAIPSLALGTMLGSYIMKRSNPDRLGMIKMILFSKATTTILTISLLFLGCETIDVAGVTTPYSDSAESNVLSPSSSCNADCECSNGTYAPICGADGVSYLSPCHAGCKGVYSEIQGLTQNYTECSCVNQHVEETGDHSDWSHPERCQRSKCGHLVILVLVIKAVGSFIGGIGATPTYVYLMRSVGKEEKAFAIGVAYMLTRLLAWIPGPILYGKAIDSTCLYWVASLCGNKGYCRIFDNDAYRTLFYSILLSVEFAACCCCVVLYYITRNNVRSTTSREDYAAVKEEENRILLRGPNNSIRAAARLASECESVNSADINGNGLTMKDVFSSKEMLA